MQSDAFPGQRREWAAHAKVKTMSSQSRSPHSARRRFLLRSSALLVSVPLGGEFVLAQQDAEKVDENSPQAKALHYRHKAEQVKDPKRQANQYCHNCQFFQSQKQQGWAPCTIFAGKQVAAGGWCSSWVKRAG